MSDIMFDITGKNAIVTGASRGIGKAFTEALLENGCKVVLIAHEENRLKMTADEFRARGLDAYYVTADFSDNDETAKAFDKALEILGGRLDIMVSNAATQARYAPEDFPIDEFEHVMRVNLHHMVIMDQKAIRVMLKQPTGGKIINTASLGSWKAANHISAYSASKGAIAMYTKSLAVDCSSRGINVNAIAPGYTLTEILNDLPDDQKKAIGDRIPQKRWGTPNDLKGALLFLASSASDYVNGAIIPVDGAFLAKL